MAGDALASAITLIDGLNAIGGCLENRHILPVLLKTEMNAQTGMMDGPFRAKRRCATDDEKSFSPVLPGDPGCR